MTTQETICLCGIATLYQEEYEADFHCMQSIIYQLQHHSPFKPHSLKRKKSGEDVIFTGTSFQLGVIRFV